MSVCVDIILPKQDAISRDFYLHVISTLFHVIARYSDAISRYFTLFYVIIYTHPPEPLRPPTHAEK